jgi:spermidine synthase
MALILYLLFFLSGAAALVYEIAWVRSLSLVFGGSHLAVTTVLAVYMGGLALGSRWLGRRADASRRPLRLYGWLELGIAALALVFIGLLRIYPAIYVPLARVAEENRFYLSALRVAFAVVALLAPTTLMGGTLPVLSRFVGKRPDRLGSQLAFLYGLNTAGAVAGSLAAGFLLLKTLGVTATLLVAAATNLLVGLAALSLPERRLAGPAGERADRAQPEAAAVLGEPGGPVGALSSRLVLWGIGVSGFCALGYEVLWTRMLGLVVGTSVYSFTIILVAFLAGIALGSEAYGVAQRWQPSRWGARRRVVGFGAVQVAIGLAALAVTVLMRDLPSHATGLQSLLLGSGAREFGARQGASLAVAVAYVFVPAFLMGVAFPLAGTIHAAGGRSVGRAVGEVLTYNTVGAILGSAVSGFVLIYAFGIERSLQMLAVLNAAVGLTAALSVLTSEAPPWGVAAGAATLLLALGVAPGWGRSWDLKYFAVFRNNQRQAFDTPWKRQDALENTDVLYYFEGANEIISVIRPKGAQQAFLVNGRPEATTSPMDVQCQRTLGHLPMLLHRNPRRVFVLGTGTGMTLGATSIHPAVDRIVLAEIEPGAIGAARTFREHNHGVLDDPRLRIVFNDGRNYLATTREKFDVVTADPIHPWSGGAAYLYTAEYFRIAADHLLPGGLACQWLPIYELTVRDVQTVVRTFSESFKYVMVWLTHYDAELLGSNDPIVIDEADLARRIARPEIEQDLRAVDMASAEDFLSYFVVGTEGARAFGQGGVVNTDDNLFLEFSAPESMGVGHLMGDNVQALARVRESLLPHLAPAAGEAERRSQQARWDRNLSAARLYDPAHALFLWGRTGAGEFPGAMDALEKEFPGYGPYRFLRRETQSLQSGEPRLAGAVRFPVEADGGTRRELQISAVAVWIGDTRAALVFVDNEKRDVYGQRYFDGPTEQLRGVVERFAAETLEALRTAYGEAAAEAGRGGQALPSERATVRRLKERVAARVAGRFP